MILLPLQSVIYLHKYFAALNEASCDQWLHKSGDCGRLIIDLEMLSHIKEVKLFPHVVDKADVEVAVVLICDRVLCALRVLLNEVHLEVFSMINVGKDSFFMSQTISLHLYVFITLVSNCDAVLGVLGDDHVHYGVS